MVLRSYRGGMKSTHPVNKIAILAKKVARPRHKVLHPLARWLSGDPHL